MVLLFFWSDRKKFESVAKLWYLQEDAFEEIADLFNDVVFPLDRSVNIYEKLEKDTEMKIERKDGKLYFKKQQIAALTQPVLYAPSVDPYFEDFNTNVFDDRTECSDNSDCVSF